MDVLIDKKKMEVSVLSGDKVLKNESILRLLRALEISMLLGII
jgi:hypothetical protein